MTKIIEYTLEYRDKLGKKTGKKKIMKHRCGDPCKNFIMGGCGICPSFCHQPNFDKDGEILN